MDRLLCNLDRGVIAIALVVLVLGAAGGPGWTDASHAAVLGSYLERTASAPLHGILAGVAAYLPVGEPGFRLALLGAVLGALVLLGVIRAARALLPDDPVAGFVAAALLVLAPPFREAAGVGGPASLAACVAVWSLALAARHARAPAPRLALGALAWVAVVIGSAPWLGVALGLAITGWLARSGAARAHLVFAGGGIGVLAIAWWIGALGALPAASPSLTAMVAASGVGAAAVLIGAGLVGAGFAAATGLPSVRWLALAIVLAGAHAIVFDPAPVVLLALLAVGSAVLPGAVVRVVGVVRRKRHLVAAIAGLPLLGAAVLAGPATGVDDPGAAPARLAADLLDELPPGPGVVVTTRPTTWFALEYAQAIAGARPDLRAVPPLPAETADVIVANALRAGKIAAADVFAFGRLDPRRAFPRGRGFELLGAEPTALAPVRPPARYASATGAREAVLLALALARYEGGFGRLEAAAHAAGLATRFGAADLAILATSRPSRPALFGFVPTLGTPIGPWLLELLGDDLAWVAGIDPPVVDGPPPRRLHALWRDLLTGKREPDDPAIAALGPDAVAATAALLAK